MESVTLNAKDINPILNASTNITDLWKAWIINTFALADVLTFKNDLDFKIFMNLNLTDFKFNLFRCKKFNSKTPS